MVAFAFREFYKTTTVVKYVGNEKDAIAVVALNRSLFTTVLRELLLEGNEHVVEVYDEVVRMGWRLSRSASPGRLTAFEDELYRSNEMVDIPVVMAARVVVRDSQLIVSLAYANTSTRQVGACEFVDDDQFCSLEAAVVQIGAKECVVPKEAASTPEGRKLRDVLARCGALATDWKPSDFSPKDLETDLGRLLKSNIEHYRVVIEQEGTKAVLAALLKFTELLVDQSNYGKFALVKHDMGRYMRLDSSALRALNTFKHRTDANDSFCLFGQLNKCRTPMGKRLLHRWLKQPLLDLAEINRRHDIVEAMVDDAVLRDRLRGAHLRVLPDIERLTRKLERGKCTLQDLCRLYQASAQLPLIAEALEQYEGPHAALLKELYGDALAAAHDDEHLGKFEALLEASVDLDKIPDEYTICATYDPELGELQQEKDKVAASIQQVHEDAAAELKLQVEKVLKLERSHLGYFFRISKKEETSVRAKLASRFQVIEARKDGTKFTSK
eukprot:gene14890-17603_t